MSREDLRAALEDMARRGLIHFVERDGARTYLKAPFAIGFYEGQVDRLTPEFEHDAVEYLTGDFAKAIRATKTPQLRAIPVGETVRNESGVMPYDDIRRIVRESDGPFAAINCICRQGKALLGEPCKQTRTSANCLMLGVAARSTIDSGKGREISRDDMLGLLDAADREGLVLQPQNVQNPIFICCCCGCCCGVLRSAKTFPDPAAFMRASYYAVVDEAACELCGTCVDRCQIEAISLGTTAAEIRLSHCIGCGLCATTCPSTAISVRRKETATEPPADMTGLYKQMFLDRYGAWGTTKLLAGHATGRKF
jgi:ferredoxin